ncbi:homeobox-leucine zipper protein HOX14-like [Musa acuminata AAA Group]|uniref:homeobox-leucine zipper protein HOX14-like n=1 Tax=Musa acuminata AAA Group TaxID=214697 RepID=UPI0031D6E01C
MRVRQRRKKNGKGDEEGGGDAKKRWLSNERVKFLEMSFGEEKKLEFGRKFHLAAELGLVSKQVAIWFQNRQAQHKSKQVEVAYLKLKAVHDATVIETCHLENET